MRYSFTSNAGRNRSVGLAHNIQVDARRILIYIQRQCHTQKDFKRQKLLHRDTTEQTVCIIDQKHF